MSKPRIATGKVKGTVETMMGRKWNNVLVCKRVYQFGGLMIESHYILVIMRWL
jgi:hypothetical protein